MTEALWRPSHRVLMLAYFFPPDTTGGVPRTVKFIKYLARLGWDSTVIAPEWQAATQSSVDSTFATSLPRDTAVVRVGVGGDDRSPLWDALYRVPGFWRVEGAARKHVDFPDVFASWYRQVLPVARRLIVDQPHNVIYSTSPPVTSHRVALRLKKEFGLPWVADFRDPWTDNDLAYGHPAAWRRWLDLRLERDIYRHADRVIANTESNRARMIERHGVPPEKVATITNGYDDEDFAGIFGTPPIDRFRITYTGSFYFNYNPTTFLRALKLFLQREPGARIVLTLAGSACDWARGNISDPELLAHLELLGQLPYREVYSLMASSHLLFQTQPQGIAYWVPGKLYEYLRSGRPIVAVCDRPSEVESILKRTGRGRVFRPDETDELAEFLRAAYSDWLSPKNASPTLSVDDRIRPYERSALSRRLADVFEAII